MKKEAPIILKAIIFDMDGVLVDSEMHWQEVGSQLASRWVPKWTANDRTRIMGLGSEPLYELLCNDYECKGLFSDFKEDYNESIKSVYTNKCHLLEGVLDLLLELKQTDLLLAVATSSTRAFLDTVIQRFDLQNIFDVTLAVSDINCPGKPYPDIYLRTAEKLGVEVNACMAIEDSWAGVTSAIRARMKVIGLNNGFNGSQDLSAADSYLNSFREVNANAILERFHT